MAETPVEYLLEGYDIVRAQLWTHQREAVEFLAEYVQGFSAGDGSGSRLVALPTGSGKSGIIATVARFLPISGAILVVVPRDELRLQLSADIDGRFFENASVPLAAYPRTVRPIRRRVQFWIHPKGVPMLRSWKADSPEEGHILVTTIQLLERIWEEEGRFGRLRGEDETDDDSPTAPSTRISDHLISQVGLVVFDEGHYEPAPKWAQVIRSFRVPRVVFTATPFRNDLRTFDWATSKDEVFFRSFTDMVKAKRIRDVKFEHLDLPEDLAGAMDVIEKRRQDLVQEFEEDVEVIVRVGSRARILEVADAVRAKGIDYYAVHHRKTSKEDQRSGEPTIRQRYPVDHEKRVPYWIHQKKLIEGIDRPQISMLVILDKLGSLRALVQQIGRLTRRSKGGAPSRTYALVIDHTGEIEHQWQRYQALEQSMSEEDFTERTPDAVVRRVFDAFADSARFSPIYADGRVREVLDPSASQGPWDNQFRLEWGTHLLVRRTAQVLQMREPDRDWQRACHEIHRDSTRTFDRMWQLDTANRANMPGHVDDSRSDGEPGNPFILLGISSAVSPFLADRAFFDIRLDVVLAYRTDPFVLFFDSAGRDLRRLTSSLGSGCPEVILQLLKEFEGQRLRSVSTKNTRMGPTTTTSRTFRGTDLTRVPSRLDEGTHVVTAAAGYRGLDHTQSIESTPVRRGSPNASDEPRGREMLRRYVGVRARRVSDAGQMVSVNHYCVWAEEIADDLRRALSVVGSDAKRRDDGRLQMLSYFRRFAPEADRVPQRWEPAWILVDLAAYEGEYALQRVAGKGGRPLSTAPGEEHVQAQDEEKLFPVLESGLAELKQVGDAHRWKGQLDVVKGDPIGIEVTFKERLGRYVLHCRVLDSFRPQARPDGDTILQELNQTQSFSIVPEEDGFFYTMGAFYQPGLGLGPGYQDEQTGLLEMVTSLPELRDVHSEKGKEGELNESATTWPESSLFGLVDAAAGGHIEEIEDEGYRRIAHALAQHWGRVLWLVCDDMGPERADFVALTERGGDRFVIMIHAKTKPGDSASSLSAKQIHEVSAQAIKNLDFLGPRLADHSRDWANPWRRRVSEGAALNRIRVTPEEEKAEFATGVSGLSQRAHEVFERAVRNPSVRREVWLLMGATLEKAALDSVLRAEKRSYQQVPPIYLLYATSAAVASSNALLRVFSH